MELLAFVILIYICLAKYAFEGEKKNLQYFIQVTMSETVYFLVPPLQSHKREKYVIITSKRRFDVMITCLLRYVFARTAVHFDHGLSVTQNDHQGGITP